MPNATLDKPEDRIGTEPVVLTIGDREYTVGGPLDESYYAQSFGCAFAPKEVKGATWYERILAEEGEAQHGIVKIVRSQEYNDLAQNEATILEEIYPPKESDEKFYRYLPRLLSWGSLPSGRWVNVFAQPEGMVPLSEIIKAYPDGIDFRDTVWMLKRLLVGLGFAHKQGVAHGAVLPSNVLVHPVGHGAKLTDWSAAVKAGDRIHVVNGAYEAYYPSEVWDKETARQGTDIYMAAKCMVRLLGGNVATNEMPDAVPGEIQDFLRGCLGKSVRSRPGDAWELHERFDGLLLKLVGKPVYRPFSMPGSPG